ncbi:MAG: hypothetical protein R6X19_01105 [Kiritimatiellia bacterium]
MKRALSDSEDAYQVRTILGMAGIYLICFGIFGGIWSVRATMAYRLYARIILDRPDTETVLRLSRQSLRAYSRQYALCIRAAETAFAAVEKAPNPQAAEQLRNETVYYVGRGSDLNPWLMELHYLKARLAARESPEAAVAIWEEYVEWHFWDPGNLEILARFQEEAGQLREALSTLDYLKAWPRHNAWRKRLREMLEKKEAASS